MRSVDAPGGGDLPPQPVTDSDVDMTSSQGKRRLEEPLSSPAKQCAPQALRQMRTNGGGDDDLDLAHGEDSSPPPEAMDQAGNLRTAV